MPEVQKPELPKKAVYRLSLYLRALQRLQEGVETISSETLALAAGVKPTQLRKDLAYIGSMGLRGKGYRVELLKQGLMETLGSARLQPVILVGVGHLGAALVRYGGFQKEGFEMVAGFDLDAGRERAADLGLTVYPMEELNRFIAEKQVKLAIVTVPGRVAQKVVDQLVQAGIVAILNFAPAILQVPEGVVVNQVDLAIELENLSYFIR